MGNREWSKLYKIRINRLPNKRNKIDTDLIVTPTHNSIQFSPTSFRWSVDQDAAELTTVDYFKFRPLLDCAIGGVQITITFDVVGMVQRLEKFPLPAFTLRV